MNSLSNTVMASLGGYRTHVLVGAAAAAVVTGAVYSGLQLLERRQCRIAAGVADSILSDLAAVAQNFDAQGPITFTDLFSVLEKPSDPQFYIQPVIEQARRICAFVKYGTALETLVQQARLARARHIVYYKTHCQKVIEDVERLDLHLGLNVKKLLVTSAASDQEVLECFGLWRLAAEAKKFDTSTFCLTYQKHPADLPKTVDFIDRVLNMLQKPSIRTLVVEKLDTCTTEVFDSEESLRAFEQRAERVRSEEVRAGLAEAGNLTEAELAAVDAAMTTLRDTQSLKDAQERAAVQERKWVSLPAAAGLTVCLGILYCL